MITLGLILAALLILGYGFFRGYRRGLSKTIFRAGAIVLHIVLAIVFTRMVYSVGFEMVQTTLLGSSPELADLFADPSISGLAIALVQMLTSAIVYLVVWFALGLILKPLELLLRRIILGKNKRSLIGGAVGAFCALLMITALYSPINGMLHVASEALTAVNESAAGQQSLSSLAPVVDTVAEVDTSFVSRAQRALGGKAYFSLVTTVKYGETKTNLNKESEAILGMVDAAMAVASKPMEEWSTAEMTAIHNLAASFGQSRLLPQAASSILASANTKWEAGQTFCGVAKPDVGTPAIQPTVDLLLRSVCTSTPEEFSHTLVSLADLFGVLGEHGALNALTGGNDSLTSLLSDKELLPDMMNCMYGDKNLRLCVPELINIGLRIMGESMGIAADKQELYTDFMGEIAAKFNAGLAENATKADRLSALTDDMMAISNSYGMHMTEAGALYVATYLIEDLGDAPVTAEDVQLWFASYAASADTEADLEAAPMALSSLPVIFLNQDNGFSGGASYAGAIPTQYMEFTYMQDGETVKISVFTRTDGSLLVQEQGADGAASTTWENVQQFVASLDGKLTLKVNKGEIKKYSSTLPAFAVTVKPRAVNATEAALVNASFMLSLKAEDALNQLADVLPTFVASPEEKLPLPKCVQKVLKDIIPDVEAPKSAAEFIAAARVCAETTGFSTGNTNTLSDSDSMKTERVTVADMVLDSETIAQNLPELDQEAITESLSEALGAASSLLGATEGGSLNMEDALGVLNGIQGAITELERPTESNPVAPEEEKTSTTQNIVSGVLGSDIVKDALPVEDEVIGDITASLGGATAGSPDLLNDITGLIEAFTAVLDEEADPEVALAKLSDVLTNLSADGAKTIAKLLNADLFEKFGMKAELAKDIAPLCSGFFSDLAHAKATMTEAEFRAEADALQALLSLVLNANEKDTDSDHYFGTDGRLGVAADDLLEQVMQSKVLTHNLLKVVVANPSGMRFNVRGNFLALVEYDSMPAEDRAALQAAIDAYWAENSVLYADANKVADLWINSGNWTKTDIARRLTVISILLGTVEDPKDFAYGTLFEGHNQLRENSEVERITVKSKKGSGEVSFTLMADGSVVATVKNGGVAGILENERTFDPEALSPELALRLVITENDISWNAQKGDTDLRVFEKNLVK